MTRGKLHEIAIALAGCDSQTIEEELIAAFNSGIETAARMFDRGGDTHDAKVLRAKKIKGNL